MILTEEDIETVVKQAGLTLRRAMLPLVGKEITVEALIEAIMQTTFSEIANPTQIH
jgi:hypothetical protein